jgi:phosphatidate cytidylyltransferase
MTPTAHMLKQRSDLLIRFGSGIIAVIVTMLVAYLGWWLLTALLLFIAVVGVLEFCALKDDGNIQPDGVIAMFMAVVVVIGVQLQQNPLWIGAMVVGPILVFAVTLLGHGLREAINRTLIAVIGVLYVALPLGCLITIRARPNDGLIWLLAVFAATWGTDLSAYFGGKLWGKTPLAPTISPNKTREGALFGIIGGLFWSLFIFGWYGMLNPITIAYAFIVPFFCVLGDLLESQIKRYFGVKDSRLRRFNPLPGHGGMLDRVDGMLLVSTASFLFIAIFVR